MAILLLSSFHLGQIKKRNIFKLWYIQEGWYIVQELKLWYGYIIMVRSGNAALDLCFDFSKLFRAFEITILLWSTSIV